MAENDKHSDLNARKWNARAETYDQRRFDFMRFMQKRTLDLVTIRHGMSLLDIGCATGWAVRHAAKLAGENGSSCGIDISPRMIEKATAQTPENRNIQFQVANAEELPFPCGRFDVVLCTNSFHHYKYPEKVLLEIKRVLKPDGMVCITDLTTDSAFAKVIDNRQRTREPEHIGFYSTKEYQKMFTQAGLEYIKTKTITLTMMKVHFGKIGQTQLAPH